MERHWIPVSNTIGERFVANLRHVVRIEIRTDRPYAVLSVLRNGELKVVGTSAERSVVDQLANIVSEAPERWLPVGEIDMHSPMPGWVNADMVAVAALAADHVEMLAVDGTWLGTATEPYEAPLARSVFSI